MPAELKRLKCFGIAFALHLHNALQGVSACRHKVCYTFSNTFHRAHCESRSGPKKPVEKGPLPPTRNKPVTDSRQKLKANVDVDSPSSAYETVIQVLYKSHTCVIKLSYNCYINQNT